MGDIEGGYGCCSKVTDPPLLPDWFPEELQQNRRKFYGCVCFVPFFIGFCILMSCIISLGPTEQVLVITESGNGRTVINGPTTMLVKPGANYKIREMLRLSALQYGVVKDVMTQLDRHVPGPATLWLQAWEEMIGVRDKYVLEARQYARFHNKYTGTWRVVKGPNRVMPEPFEECLLGIQAAYPVRNMDSLVVLDRSSGQKRIILADEAEGFYIPEPNDEVLETRVATLLKSVEYAVIKENKTGEVRHEVGPQSLHLGAYDILMKVRPKIVLQKQEYVRLIDIHTGIARIEKGAQMIVPTPPEDGLGGTVNHEVHRSIVVSSQTSVVLLNRTSGKKYETRQEGMFVPGPYEDIMEVRKAVVLKSQEYAVVQDELTGKYVHYPGPQQLFVGAYEKLIQVLLKIVLQKQQYVQLVDRRTGEETIVSGPQTITPEANQCEKDYSDNCQMKVKSAIVMKADVAVLTLNKTTGVRRLVLSDAGGIFTPAPYEEILEVRSATVLKQQDYAKVKDNMTGAFRHAEGPQLLHLDAYEELISVNPKVVLAKFEYIRLVDQISGVERVVEGPQTLVPTPMESAIDDTGSKKTSSYLDAVMTALLIDKDHAVLSVNHTTGVQTLNTQEGMWIPSPYEYLVELRSLIRVMANEAVVMRDFDGKLTVYDGTEGSAGTTFFLQPRCALVEMKWTHYNEPDAEGHQSTDLVSITKIDMRIQRTYYSFEVRTNDNVRLMLMGTIFWRVQNVSAMILGTSDPSGDVWQHSRSSFLQSVSNSSFDNFMTGFNKLAQDAFERDSQDNFYQGRGVGLLSMEVTRFEAVDHETKLTLQRINDETTNQITLLKKQEGENAVRAAKMRADITLEEEQTQAELNLEVKKTALIKTRADNELIQKTMNAEGEAQPFAQHAKSFIQALNSSGVTVDSGLSLYQALRDAEYHNTDTKNLASGKATLFLTSSDVKLNVRDLNLGGNHSGEGAHEHNDL